MYRENTFNLAFESILRTLFTGPALSPEEYYRRALRAFKRDDFTNCIQCIDQFFGNTPASGLHHPLELQAHFLRGQAFYALGEYQAAARDIEIYLKKAPRNPEAYLLLARAQRKMKRLEMASDTLTEGIKVLDAAGLAELYDLRGQLQQESGRWLEAIDDYTLALKTDLHYSPAFLHRALLLADRGRFREALSDSDEARRLAPQNALAHYACGYAYWRMDQPQLARPHLEEAFALDTANPIIHHLLAEVLRRTGDQELAISLVQQFVPEAPASREASGLKSTDQEEQGHHHIDHDHFQSADAGTAHKNTPQEQRNEIRKRNRLQDDHTIYRIVEKPPLFLHYEWLSPSPNVDPWHHSNLALEYFLETTMQYPENAERVGVEGAVTVHFIIEKDGSISHIQARGHLGFGCEEEAIRLFNKMNELGLRWEPAQINDQPVRMASRWQVRFRFRCD